MAEQSSNQGYEAFISYRHVVLDAAVARRVHAMIENFRIPRAVKRLTGKSKMGKVFRDQEELPFTPDLADNIKAALSLSRFLIVICSPDLPRSRWCLKEISDFIDMRGRDSILPVLISGDEGSAIPPQLRGIAPAADLREGIDQKVMNREITKLLARMLSVGGSVQTRRMIRHYRTRILAPILNMDEKELNRRLRESGLIRRGAAVLAAALIIGLVGAYGVLTGTRIARNNALIIRASEQVELARMKAEEQDLAAQIGQAEYLAALSSDSFERGDAAEALRLALEALPDNLSAPDLPVTKAAEGALRSAEMSDTLISGHYELARHIDFGVKPDAVSTAHALTILIYSRELYNNFGYWDILNGERLVSPDPTILNGVPLSAQFGRIRSDISGPYIEISAAFDDRLESYGPDGQVSILAKETEKGTGTYTKTCYPGPYAGYVLYGSEHLPMGLRGTRVQAKLSGEPFCADEVMYAGEYICAWQDHGRKGQPPKAGVWDRDVEEALYELDIPAGIVRASAAGNGGSLLAVDRAGLIHVYAVPSGQRLSRLSCDAGYAQAVFAPGDMQIIAIDKSGSCLLLNAADGSVVVSYPSEGSILSARPGMGSDVYSLLCACSDNRARIFDLSSGRVLYTLGAKGPLSDARYMGNEETGISLRTETIALIGESSARIYEFVEEDKDADQVKRSILLDAGTTKESIDHVLFSPDGSRLALVARYGRLSVYDARAGTLLWFDYRPVESGGTIQYEVPAFIADGSALWYPMSGNAGKIWLKADSVSGRELMRVSLADEKGAKTLGTPQFLMDGSLILFRTMSWLDDEAVCVLDADSGEVRWSEFFYSVPRAPGNLRLKDMAVHEAGSELLISFEGTDGKTSEKIWRVDSRDLYTGAHTGSRQFILPRQTYDTAFSPDGRYWMAFARDEGINEARVYDMTTGAPVDTRLLQANEAVTGWYRSGEKLLIERLVPGSGFSAARILWTPGGIEEVFSAGTASWRECGAARIDRIGEHERVCVVSDRYIIDIDSGDRLMDGGSGSSLTISPDGKSAFRYANRALPRIILWRPLSEVIDSAKRMTGLGD